MHGKTETKKENPVIKLCGVQGCCPELHLGEKEVVITDDFNGKVTLTHEQFEDLKKKVKNGELD